MRGGHWGESHLPSNAPRALEGPRLLLTGFQALGEPPLPTQSSSKRRSPGPGARRPSCGSHSHTKSGLFSLLDCPGHVQALCPQSPRWTSASELSNGISDDLVSMGRCKEISNFQDTYEE